MENKVSTEIQEMEARNASLIEEMFSFSSLTGAETRAANLKDLRELTFSRMEKTLMEIENLFISNLKVIYRFAASQFIYKEGLVNELASKTIDQVQEELNNILMNSMYSLDTETSPLLLVKDIITTVDKTYARHMEWVERYLDTKVSTELYVSKDGNTHNVSYLIDKLKTNQSAVNALLVSLLDQTVQ